MKNQLASFLLIRDSLQNQIPVVLLYVLESKGSSPGRQGFCMAINVLNQMQGSLGGGIMEHKFVELAKENLKKEQPLFNVVQQVHDKLATKNRSGMICSGQQTIFLYRANATDLPSVEKMVNSLQENKNGCLTLNATGIHFEAEAPEQNFSFTLLDDQNFIYQEKTGFKNRLFVVGGGHCSLALCKLVGDMDFYITVIDTRPNLHTLNENLFAHKKIILQNYSELAQQHFTTDSIYMVLMTFGYRTDAEALKALVGKGFKYLGMLGSKNKIAELRQQFLQDGVSEEWLQQVDAPAGMAIKSQTPEEIAVSIAAKIISVKNNG